MAKEKITYDTRVKSVNVKSECDSLLLDGKEFSSDERDTLIRWAKDKELIRITLAPVQERLLNT